MNFYLIEVNRLNSMSLKKHLFLIVGSCQSHQLECQSGVCKQTYKGCEGSCIPKSWFNDGIEDCYDGSDEIEIGGNIIK